MSQADPEKFYAMLKKGVKLAFLNACGGNAEYAEVAMLKFAESFVLESEYEKLHQLPKDELETYVANMAATNPEVFSEFLDLTEQVTKQAESEE